MARQNAALINGEIYVNGVHFTKLEFEELFPVKGKLVTETQLKHLKKQDIDSTKNWH